MEFNFLHERNLHLDVEAPNDVKRKSVTMLETSIRHQTLKQSCHQYLELEVG